MTYLLAPMQSFIDQRRVFALAESGDFARTAQRMRELLG